jgi:sortase A
MTLHGRTFLTIGALVGLGVSTAVRTRGHKEEESPQRSLPDAIAAIGEPMPSAAPPEAEPPPPPRKSKRGRLRRRLGKIMIALGIVLIGYSAAIVVWGDPVTYLYAHWKQHQLAGQLDKEFEAYAAALGVNSAVAERSRGATAQEIVQAQRELVERAANRLNRHLKLSHPLGRIKIPKIGVKAIVVQGTRWGPDLSQGPGHYPQSSLPGVGRTMAIAAHRTTFGAWFRHIDSLRDDDRITLRLPYATFHYRVFKHEIVKSGDWSIIHDRGFDTLVLSACHPLYSASHRWIVFAALVRVDPVRGVPYLVNRHNEVRPLTS